MWLSYLDDPEDSEADQLDGCEEMDPGEGDLSQVGVVRLVLRRHKYCNMNPSIISLFQEMNPGDGDP
jgi:hypothetical protein